MQSVKYNIKSTMKTKIDNLENVKTERERRISGYTSTKNKSH